MLLIDIGNTSISFGLVKKDYIESYSIPKEEYPSLKKYSKLADIIIISSVVPTLNKTIKNYFSGKTIFVDHNNIPIKIKTKNPNEIGSDRLVNAYAGIHIYGSPIIIIDFGTATTFDIVSKNKEYLGGIICPGLELSRQNLAKNTEKLPLVSLKRPVFTIGKTTVDSMLSGFVFGYEEMIKGLLNKIKKEISKNILVCATGGYSRLICENMPEINIIDPTLTLEGLMLLGKTLRP